MTSGCIFKNGAPTQVLSKVRILTKFGLSYTMRENVKIRKIQISFISCIYWPSYAKFSMRRFFIDVSISWSCFGNAMVLPKSEPTSPKVTKHVDLLEFIFVCTFRFDTVMNTYVFD